MNLIRDNYSEKKHNNSLVTIIIVVMVILAIVAALLFILISNLQNKKFKFIVDETSYKVSDEIFKDVNGVRYINVKTISNTVNYEYNNGEYNNPYEEDKTKCYVKCDNEIASFISGTNKIYKVALDDAAKKDTKTQQSVNSDTKQTVVSNENTLDSIEYYELKDEIKLIDGEIYATEQAIKIGFNISFNYNTAINKVEIYTLPYLVKKYSSVENSVLDEKCEFSNQKLLLYDMILVKNSKNEYGVKKISNSDAVLGTKYAAIKFIESSMNFIITTENGKQGISSTTETKISPQYDELKQLDKDLDLYLVKNGTKYGVINGEGNVVIYMEYDQIGMDTSAFINNDLDNQYILYKKYIPVKRDEKWGLMRIDGTNTVPAEYDQFGCTTGTAISKTENNLLLVPDVKGIVVCQNGLYGLITPDGSKLVPVSLSEMYKTTNSGVNTYYMTYNSEKIDILQWIKAKANSASGI